MIFQGVFLAALVAIQLVNALPLADEKIEPVSLSYSCIYTIAEGQDHNKSPVLIIHGLTSSSHTWDGIWEVIATLTARKVCIVDLRNHGNSPWNNRTDVNALTADIANFLDRQNIQKVNLIGHSLGGKISMNYALNNAERVNSVIVEDMRPNGVSEDGAKLVQSVMHFLAEGIKTVPKEFTEDEARNCIIDYLNERFRERNISQTFNKRTSQGLALRFDGEKWQYKMNLELLIEAFKKPEELLTESSGLYTGPTLFIWGKSSPIDVISDKENILKLFPNATFVGVEGAGHHIHGNFPQFTDESVKFLNSLST